MAPIGHCVRVVIHERLEVAELLAGGHLEAAAGDLVDPELRAVAWAVLALRAWRLAPGDQLDELVRVQGASISGGDLEQLRREGALRRALSGTQ